MTKANPSGAGTDPGVRSERDKIDLRYCNCADPENCREAVPGYVCRKGQVADPGVPRLTKHDYEQIAEGIEHFIMDGDPDVDAIWQPYVDRLLAAAARLAGSPDLQGPAGGARSDALVKSAQSTGASNPSGAGADPGVMESRENDDR